MPRFRPFVRAAALAAVCAVAAGHAAAAGDTSTYTTVVESACRKLAPRVEAAFEKRGMSPAVECSAPAGWRLFVGGDTERSWIELARGTTVWGTRHEVVESDHFGLFPSVQGKAEWRHAAGSDAPVALIVRIHAQDPEDAFRPRSRLMVIGLAGNQPRFCGAAKTNEEARALADKSSDCTPLATWQLK